MTDITDPKPSEEKFNRSALELASIIRISPDIVYRLDSEGNIVFVSEAVKNYGYTPEELIGQNILNIVHPEDREGARNRINERRTGDRGTRRLELRFLTKNQDSVYMESLGTDVHVDNVFLIDAEGLYQSKQPRKGTFLGSQGIARDITERKIAEKERERLEEQLMHAQRMEAIGTLAGGIAHDFNNILAIIIGYTEIGLLYAGNHHKLTSGLRKVLAACSRARELVAQILSFNRPSEEILKPIQLGPIVKEVLKLLRDTLPATIKIKQKIETDSGIVMADDTKIHQILMNLCTNAYHAMFDGEGELTLHLCSEELKTEKITTHFSLKPGRYSKLSVSDTGYGMDQSAIKRIFEPYFTTRTKGEGTGLGLAVVHGIVKSYQGAVIVESQPGKGSVFHVYLPLVESEISVNETELIKSLPVGRESILFIDDEQDIVDIGKQMLEHLGYTVHTTISSIKALEVFRTQPDKYDLVITDQSMPDLMGRNLAKEMLLIRPDIPIILCTGYSDFVCEETAKEIGIFALAMKPLVIEEMAKMIRKVLDSRH